MPVIYTDKNKGTSAKKQTKKNTNLQNTNKIQVKVSLSSSIRLILMVKLMQSYKLAALWRF